MDQGLPILPDSLLSQGWTAVGYSAPDASGVRWPLVVPPPDVSEARRHDLQQSAVRLHEEALRYQPLNARWDHWPVAAPDPMPPRPAAQPASIVGPIAHPGRSQPTPDTQWDTHPLAQSGPSGRSSEPVQGGMQEGAPASGVRGETPDTLTGPAPVGASGAAHGSGRLVVAAQSGGTPDTTAGYGSAMGKGADGREARGTWHVPRGSCLPPNWRYIERCSFCCSSVQRRTFGFPGTWIHYPQWPVSTAGHDRDFPVGRRADPRWVILLHDGTFSAISCARCHPEGCEIQRRRSRLEPVIAQPLPPWRTAP